MRCLILSTLCASLLLFATPTHAALAISASATAGNAPLDVTFSLEADGTVVSSLWDFGDGSTSKDPGPLTHTYSTYGTYTVTVTVTDDQGGSTQDSMQISVSEIRWSADRYQFWYSVDENGGMTGDAVSSLYNSNASGPVGIRTNTFGWNDPVTSGFSSHYEDGLVHLVLDAGAGGGLSDLGVFARAYAAADLNLAETQSLWVEQKVTSWIARDFAVNSPEYYDLIATLNGVIEFDASGTETSNPRALKRAEGWVLLKEYTAGARAGVLRQWSIPLDDLVADGRLVRNVWLRPAHEGSPVAYTLLVGFQSVASNIVDFDWQAFFKDVGGGRTDPLLSGSYRLGNPDQPLEIAASLHPGTASNQPPIVGDIQASPRSGHVPLELVFSCSASDPPDGAVISYAWDFGDATISGEQNPGHIYTSPGTYTVTLTVTDDDGATVQRGLTVFADPPNVPPTARLSASVTAGVAPLAVTFTLDAQDSDGRIVSYKWDFGDGNTDTGPGPKTHTYGTAGAYHVEVTAVDDDGATAIVTLEISVINPSPPPPPVVPPPATPNPVTPPPAPPPATPAAQPTSPARARLGLNPGLRTYFFPADEVFDLMVNMTNRAGEQPVHEWLAFGAIMGKISTPVYLLTGNGVVAFLPEMNIYIATYPYDHTFETMRICALALGDLGFVAGDQLIYAYVYENVAGEIVIENIVTVNAL